MRSRAARLRLQQLSAANARQRLRKDAVTALNLLATDLGVVGAHVPLKGLLATEPKVERLIRALEHRCQSDDLSQRLRGATQLWRDNGGALSQPMTEAPVLAEEDGPQAPDDFDDTPLLPRHKVLQSGYILQSKAFMLTFNSDSLQAESWVSFLLWVKKQRKDLGARAWAACIELSTHARPATCGPRHHLHCYFFWTDGVGIFRRNLNDLQFNDIKPRVDKCLSHKGVSPRTAACHGLWHASVMKLGTLQSATNYEPGVAYKVPRGWVDSLYDDGKLSHSQYMHFSKQYPLGHAARKRDVDEMLRSEHQAAVASLVQAERTTLEAMSFWRPRRQFHEVDLFLAAHTGAACDRRPLLAIIGGTGTGKSLLAAAVLEELAAHHGLPGFLETTVEDDGHFDLSDFRVDKHAGILLDGVGDVAALQRARETLQGRPKLIKGGRSATMVYAYTYTLCRRGVVATFDLSARNLQLFKFDHWLKDPRNVIQLRLTSPAWSTGATAETQESGPEERMRAWTVAETARFLDENDLAGPADIARASGVNGSDLLQLSLDDLIKEVRMTPFAAKKVVAARAAFLSS